MNRYWLIGGAAALGILIAVSVVAAIFQSEEEFAPGSAEAAVQAYLSALEDEDFQAVHDALSPELRAECSVEDMFEGRNLGRHRIGERRITLEDVRALEETTFVTVRIAQFSDGGLFVPSEYEFEEDFALRQFDGVWKFSKDPWPYFRCETSATTGGSGYDVA